MNGFESNSSFAKNHPQLLIQDVDQYYHNDIYFAEKKNLLESIQEDIKNFEQHSCTEGRLILAYIIYKKSKTLSILDKEIKKYLSSAKYYLQMILDMSNASEELIEEKMEEILYPYENKVSSFYHICNLPHGIHFIKKNSLLKTLEYDPKFQYDFRVIKHLCTHIIKKMIKNISKEFNYSAINFDNSITNIAAQEQYRVIINSGHFYKEDRLSKKNFTNIKFVPVVNKNGLLKKNQLAWDNFVVNTQGQLLIFSNIEARQFNKIAYSLDNASKFITAGEIKINDQGKLIGVSNRSNYYNPTIKNLVLFLKYLRKHNIDMSCVEVQVVSNSNHKLEKSIKNTYNNNLKYCYTCKATTFIEKYDHLIRLEEFF